MGYTSDMVTKAAAWDALMQEPLKSAKEIERLKWIEQKAKDVIYGTKSRLGGPGDDEDCLLVSQKRLKYLCEALNIGTDYVTQIIPINERPVKGGRDD